MAQSGSIFPRRCGFYPYREQYRQVIHSSKMHYVETYNASEGYFGTQNDLSDPSMLLMIDYGVFYEFIPLEDVEKKIPVLIAWKK